MKQQPTPEQECMEYLKQKLDQLAGVVEMKYSAAVEGARDFGRAQRPDLMDRCNNKAEEHLGDLMANAMIVEFRVACVDFFRAELELYKAHAEFLGLLAAA
jgi:hypothetical protein